MFVQGTGATKSTYYESEEIHDSLMLVIDVAKKYMLDGISPDVAQNMAFFDVMAKNMSVSSGFYVPDAAFVLQ